MSVYLLLRRSGLIVLLLFPLWLAAQPMEARLAEYRYVLKQLHEKSTRDQLNAIQSRGLLDIHLFNLSYTKGIGTFLRFKNIFHMAEAGSDMPMHYSPIQYLREVIDKYEQNGKYKVAVLYYDDGQLDSQTEVNRIIQGEKTLQRELEEMDRVSDEQMVVNSSQSRVRVWYISDKKFGQFRTGFSYKDLSDEEIRYRRFLGVSLISASRNPRGNLFALNNDEIVAIDSFENSGVHLSEMVLPEGVKELLKKDSINGVIIIPYATVGQLPFYTLPMETIGDSIVYFVDNYAFNIAPHMCNFFSVFRDNTSKIGQQNKLEVTSPLIVGNPKFFSDNQFSFPDLPGAETEAVQVASKLNSRALLGYNANYDSVLNRLKTADFVYFATHAVPSLRNPVNNSFIALSPSYTSYTGRLSIKTIQDASQGKTKLAILSACQTGIGKSYKNGYCNIGRGFYIAGVDNVMMSLWNLDDHYIIPFMTGLVDELREPSYFYPAENLRRSVLKFKQTNKNAAIWGAIVNFGVAY